MKITDVKIGVDSIAKPTDILNFLDGMNGLDHEVMYVFGFNSSAEYTLAEDVTEFSEKDTAQFSIAKIMKKLKETKSKGLIMVHNHPSGVCIPTYIDVDTTKDVINECKKKKIMFIEHFTYTNGFLWGIKTSSIDKGIYIKKEDIKNAANS